MLNKLIEDFQTQQSEFRQQLDEVNAYDLVLVENQEKV
jgi:hypothetical protein